MQGLDQILGSSGLNIDSLAARFGISPDQANAAMSSLAPAIAGGFQKRADAGNLAPVADAAGGIDEPNTAAGNKILGYVFGTKDVSRQVADHAAAQSGLSSTVTRAMLPVVAAIVSKHFANSGSLAGGGGLGGMLGSVLGGGGQAGGLGGLAGMFGGGNPLDAILGGRP